MTAIYWLAGLIVLAEALNKLERADSSITGPWREVALRWLKILAWTLLAVGGAGALVTPLLNIGKPGVQDAATMLGFAVLILRTRLKEEVDGLRHDSGDFQQTERMQR